MQIIINDFYFQETFSETFANWKVSFSAPKPIGRRARKPGMDRKPRQAYSAKQLDQLEAEFKVDFLKQLLC